MAAGYFLGVATSQRRHVHRNRRVQNAGLFKPSAVSERSYKLLSSLSPFEAGAAFPDRLDCLVVSPFWSHFDSGGPELSE
ncbi:hypothetical protein GB937_010029 [Aspergillus fischeri]|nr:hypothetical protein GB937_010029 [Aspergillus fischeri]